MAVCIRIVRGLIFGRKVAIATLLVALRILIEGIRI